VEDRLSYLAYRDALRDMAEEENDFFSLAFDSAMNIARSNLSRTSANRYTER
jgi:hypothetical protein